MSVPETTELVASENWVFLKDDSGGELYYNIVSGLTRTECPGGEGLDKIVDLTAVQALGEEGSEDGTALAVRGGQRRSGRGRGASQHHQHRLKVPERCSAFVVDHARVLAMRGTFFGMRRGVKESVAKQVTARVELREAKAALEASALNEQRTMALTATAGKPTLNSVVNRTPWNDATMTHVFAGEVALVLRQSYHRGDFTLNGAALSAWPRVLSNTLTLQMGTLTALRLSRNAIAELPPSAPKFLRSLTELDLRNNVLTALPGTVRLLTNLVDLKLDHNHISSLPDTLPDLLSLTGLRLADNWLTRLPENFGHIPHLRELHLENNRIDRLPPSMGDLGHLTTLDLTRCALTSLAIVPAAHHVEQESQEGADAWEELVDGDGNVSYYNGVTGKNSNTKPVHLLQLEAAAAALADPSAPVAPPTLWQRIDEYGVGELTLPRKRELRNLLDNELSLEHALMVGEGALSTLHNQRRKVLALLGRSEWEPRVNDATSKVYYQNYVTEEPVDEMPAALDLFGGMTSLTSLKLSANMLGELPASMRHMHWLKRLEVAENHLEKLPPGIGECHSLVTLKLMTNEIHEIPPSFTGLTSLRHLNLTSNFVTDLPWAFCTALSKLTHLYLTDNQLTRLPNSFRFMTKLAEFHVQENPLVSPSMETVNKGLAHVMWECWNEFYTTLRGPPPEVAIHTYGTANECRQPVPALEKDLQKAYEESEKTGLLALQWKHLPRMPPDVQSLTELKQLKLIGNSFDGQTVSLGPLVSLTDLTLMACRIEELAHDFGLLTSLTSLSFEDNRLEALPESTRHLTQLTFLNLCNNRLKRLPEGIGHLRQLRTFKCDVNHLAALPASTHELAALEHFSLGSNRLETLPRGFEKLASLTCLFLNGNSLSALPGEFAALPALRELRIGHNKIARLQDAFCDSPTLRTSLRKLWAFNNCLVECPQKIVNLKALTDLRLDNNPMISPPPDLLPQGTVAIMRYCRIRAARFSEIKLRLGNIGFGIDDGAFSPVSRRVLVANTGYLTPDDLEAFDQQVDHFVNGAFYLHAPTGAAIAHGIETLRDKRLHDFQIRVLNELVQLVEEEVKSRLRFSEATLDEYMVRDWGENDSDVNCFAIAAYALVRPTAANDFVREDRPSLLELLYARLPQSGAYQYDMQAVVDAINTFVGPYGRVAEITEEPVEFDACECIDAETGFQQRHEACLQKAVVIQKVIYTEEEAARKRREEDLVFRMVEAVKAEVHAWLVKPFGRKKLVAEAKRRRKALKRTIRTRRAIAARCQLALRMVLEDTCSTSMRQALFRRGQVFPMHQYHTVEDADEEVSDVNTAAKKASDKLEAAEALLRKALAQQRHTWKDWLAETTADLENKYIGIAFRKLLKEMRLKARARAHRRPWDGEDGGDFIEWSKKQELLEEQAAEGEGELEDDEGDEGDGKGEDGHLNWGGVESDLYEDEKEKKLRKMKKGEDGGDG